MFLEEFIASVNPRTLKEVEDRLYLTMREHKADSQYVLESGLFEENCFDQYSTEALGLMTVYTFHDKDDDELVYIGNFTSTKDGHEDSRHNTLYNVSCGVQRVSFNSNSISPEDLPSIKRETFAFLFKEHIISECNELIVRMVHEFEREEEQCSSTEREGSISSVLRPGR